MFAPFLVALIALLALAALGVLADSGLRWWSAFGQLRREMMRTAIEGPLPNLRPSLMAGGIAGSGGLGTRPAIVSLSRRA